MINSVVDVHGVKANAQTQLLLLHELLCCLFFYVIYSLYLYAQTPLSLSTSFFFFA